MLLQFISPLMENETFQGNKISDTKEVFSYKYVKKLRDVGTFEIELAHNLDFAIETDDLVLVDKKDMFIVNEIVTTPTSTKISGTDLKGYLSQRITLFDVEDNDDVIGYDVIAGTTETVLKNYITNNLANPTDTSRKIHGFTVAENQNRGLSDDKYMSRFERVDLVAKTICENADCGYTVDFDLSSNKFIFEFLPIVDKTINQNLRDHIVLSLKLKNISNFERKKSKSKYKNVFYATKSGGTLETDATTVLCTRKNEEIAVGCKRKEVQVSVSVDSVSEISKYAEKEMDKHLLTDNVTVDVVDGEELHLGDRVTVEINGEYYDLNVTQITFVGSKTSITLGNPEEKPLNQLSRKIKEV